MDDGTRLFWGLVANAVWSIGTFILPPALGVSLMLWFIKKRRQER